MENKDVRNNKENSKTGRDLQDDSNQSDAANTKEPVGNRNSFDDEYETEEENNINEEELKSEKNNRPDKR